MLTLLYAINRRLSASGHRLHVEQVGRCVFVHDGILAGISFALPIDTPVGGMVAAAIEGANARRRFILGSGQMEKAA